MYNVQLIDLRIFLIYILQLNGLLSLAKYTWKIPGTDKKF
jgi:hypothetical protein